eukprot:Blabericola_migrator_1__2661@NODE_1754_length_3853_cov_6_641310_g1131_i0_p3_GENE_NODE_1754_length_3853_cov_6_641310_g1131_i0NODE_1754_length_3853_cov_6_641310_g1131_i0_p3_ORF_typecomplete_len173_score40_13Integrin_beta/PF00362_18/8_2e08VWA/PF00092_28/1_2e05VWA_3/PF13768_6/4_1e05VWA_2/PF13519_6/6e05_NODE_1754_length_3853_cov_6_641310_g1131_i0136654
MLSRILMILVLTVVAECFATEMCDSEIFLLQDMTETYHSLIPSIREALSKYITDLTATQPNVKFGFAGFGDKGSDVCWKPGSPLSSDVAGLTEALSQMDASEIRGGDRPENPLETACLMAGSYAGFKNCEGDCSSTRRLIILITDASAHVGEDPNLRVPNRSVNVLSQEASI